MFCFSSHTACFSFLSLCSIIVFKVETIGDCYVAAAGVPEPRSDHAVVMARFARDCCFKMTQLVQALEILLGPETGTPM